MLYKRTEIAELMNVSPRTLQRIILRNKLRIRQKVRLSKKDIALIDSKLNINISRYLK
jgi:hypothetical protein